MPDWIDRLDARRQANLRPQRSIIDSRLYVCPVPRCPVAREAATRRTVWEHLRDEHSVVIPTEVMATESWRRDL